MTERDFGGAKFIGHATGSYSGHEVLIEGLPTIEQLQEVLDAGADLVLLDTLGCAMAGSGTEEIAQIRRAMLQANGGGGDASGFDGVA